jgi:predicted dehydrogenase
MTMTRRMFAGRGLRVGAMGMAAGVLPRAWGMGQATVGAGAGRQIGYAVIGLGEIAKHFIGGVGMSQRTKITGLVSGDRAKAEAQAAQLGIPKTSVYSYADMDRMRENKAIDAVYVALPNSMHAEYTIRSAKAGKHVLCEKPMAVSVAECQQMVDACKAASVKLMIAYRMHYEPLTLEAIGRLRRGEIGEIRAIEAAFGFDSKPGVWRLNRKLAGGGSLMDVGIYCLNATRYLTGEEPAEIKAFSYSDPKDPRFKEVEETVSWTTRFPSGILATCNTTYGGPMPGFFKVTGSKGVLEMGPAYSYEGITMKVGGGEGKPATEKTNPEKDPTQFMREAEALATNIVENTPVKASGEEGMKDIQWISRIYGAAGLPTV